MLPIPGITLAQGKDAAESARLLATGFATEGPYLLRYSKNTMQEQALCTEPLTVGRWERLHTGEMTVISYGDFLGEAEEARRLLELEGQRAACLIAMGYPEQWKNGPGRKETEELLSFR